MVYMHNFAVLRDFIIIPVRKGVIDDAVICEKIRADWEPYYKKPIEFIGYNIEGLLVSPLPQTESVSILWRTTKTDVDSGRYLCLVRQL